MGSRKAKFNFLPFIHYASIALIKDFLSNSLLVIRNLIVYLDDNEDFEKWPKRLLEKTNLKKASEKKRGFPVEIKLKTIYFQKIYSYVSRNDDVKFYFFSLDIFK